MKIKDKFPIVKSSLYKKDKKKKFSFKDFPQSAELKAKIKKLGFERTFTETEMIEFAEWTEDNGYMRIVEFANSTKYWEDMEENQFTTEELLNLYLKSKD